MIHKHKLVYICKCMSTTQSHSTVTHLYFKELWIYVYMCDEYSCYLSGIPNFCGLLSSVLTMVCTNFLFNSSLLKDSNWCTTSSLLDPFGIYNNIKQWLTLIPILEYINGTLQQHQTMHTLTPILEYTFIPLRDNMTTMWLSPTI